MAKVLIVGENIGPIDLLATTVEALDYEVVTLYESIDAQDTALAQEFSLVILEAKMNGLTGYEVSSILCGDPEIDDALPIIMLDDGYLDDNKLKSCGATETMKPEIDPSLLNEVLVRLIGE